MSEEALVTNHIEDAVEDEKKCAICFKAFNLFIFLGRK